MICVCYNRPALGIFPREPRSRKKANKGNSAPTSFYYTKDIAYLAHEPVLKKLREHKAFAKKLSRALGRGEWSSAKSLEENKPSYRLDHIIKGRCVPKSFPCFRPPHRMLDTQHFSMHFGTLMTLFAWCSYLHLSPQTPVFLPSSSRTAPASVRNGSSI